MRILAVDLGTKRTGFAISDPDERLAVALPTLQNAGPDAVAELAKEHGAEFVVVGLPLNMDGSRGPRAEAAEDFARQLQKRIPVVELWDERLSTSEGDSRLREAGLSRKERAKRSDAAAAIVILESFLAARRRKKQ